jgi:hypothetical protein
MKSRHITYIIVAVVLVVLIGLYRIESMGDRKYKSAVMPSKKMPRPEKDESKFKRKIGKK